MTDTEQAPVSRDDMPFVAPCNKLSPWAPFGWVRAGIADLMQAPQQSLTYGLAVAIMIGSICLMAWMHQSQWLMFAMLGGFVFLAPLTCIGLYAISAQLERGQPPLMARSFRAAFKRHVGSGMAFAMVLLILFFIWARAAVMIGVFFPTDVDSTLGDLLGYLAFGSMVGAVFAAFTFSASAFSLPMIMHRDVDSITAIVTSVNAVLRSTTPYPEISQTPLDSRKNISSWQFFSRKTRCVRLGIVAIVVPVDAALLAHAFRPGSSHRSHSPDLQVAPVSASVRKPPETYRRKLSQWYS